MNARIILATGLVALAAAGGVLGIAARSQTSGFKAPVVKVAVQTAPGAPSRPAPRPAPAPAPHKAADQAFVIKRILPIDGPIKYGEWHWDDKNVPAGPIVVTVDLDYRVLSVFRDGYEIGTTAVLLGTDNTPTPLGVFPITQKDKDHVSNIYTGAPMPYMQRLTNDGITLHGSNVQKGYASHGCVGMPVAFAAKLFTTTHLGDKVYITRGKHVGLGADLKGA